MASPAASGGPRGETGRRAPAMVDKKGVSRYRNSLPHDGGVTHGPVRHFHPPAGARDGNEPDDRAGRRDLLPAPVRARVPGHRSAHRVRAHRVQRRDRPGRGERYHHADRGLAVRHRGHQDHQVAKPRRGEPGHRHLRHRTRRGRGRGGRARPGVPHCLPAAGGRALARDLQGRGRRLPDHVDRAGQRQRHADAAHRLRRPLHARSDQGSARRGDGDHRRRAQVLDAGLARPRADGGSGVDGAGRGGRLKAAEPRFARAGASRARTANSPCSPRPT